jgi:hypothetical protein
VGFCWDFRRFLGTKWQGFRGVEPPAETWRHRGGIVGRDVTKATKGCARRPGAVFRGGERAEGGNPPAKMLVAWGRAVSTPAMGEIPMECLAHP